jgi:ribosomal-protein-alanine N-acetyltransferase
METALVVISTNRFSLRTLAPDDVSNRYVSWFGDYEVGQYISAAAFKPSLNSLQKYVRERSGRDNVIFLGIFEKKSGLHIGNIKYEPMNSALRYAVMGVLVGEPGWRGKGVAAEVLLASAEWLWQHRNIRQIILGVSCDNIAAIKAYSKVGFIEEPTKFVPPPLKGNMTMVWHLKH